MSRLWQLFERQIRSTAARYASSWAMTLTSSDPCFKPSSETVARHIIILWPRPSNLETRQMASSVSLSQAYIMARANNSCGRRPHTLGYAAKAGILFNGSCLKHGEQLEGCKAVASTMHLHGTINSWRRKITAGRAFPLVSASHLQCPMVGSGKSISQVLLGLQLS